MALIQNDFEEKNVHINQLKVVAPRHLKGDRPSRFIDEEKSYVNFDEFEVNDEGGEDESDRESNYLINEAWCNIDERYMLPNRTRAR